jgi:hypothetical protein
VHAVSRAPLNMLLGLRAMNRADAKLERFVEVLRHTMVTAGLNYEIWWVYKDKTSRSRFAKTMNRYTPFFQAGIHAHFVAYLVAIHRLHEKRRDTVNISRFIDALEAAGSVKPQVITAARKGITEAKPLWIKAGILRNEAFAHRAETQNISEVFRKAAVKPDELVRLNQLTKEILNGLTSHWNKTAHVFEVSAGQAATRVLEDLRSVIETS